MKVCEVKKVQETPVDDVDIRYAMQYAVNATCIAAEDGVMLVNSWRKQS